MIAYAIALAAVAASAGPRVVVRRGEYRACVRAGACPQLSHTRCRTRLRAPLLRAPKAAARAYCAWRGLAPGPADGNGFSCAVASAQSAPTPPSATAQTDEAPITLAAVGDVLFGRYRADRKYDPVTRAADPFAAVAPTLRAADIAFCNLESPMMVEPKRFAVFRSLTFRAEPARATTLAEAGFDVVSIANNHMTNIGPTAPAETRRNLRAAGLVSVGAGSTSEEAFRPAVVVVRGRSVAFLAFTTWSNGKHTVTGAGAVAFTGVRGLERTVLAAVRNARTKYDHVVVSLHWGQEYAPSAGTGQRKTARRIVDAGADIVLGHHPHVVQEIERIGRGVVAYSLGNFLFSNRRPAVRNSVILTIELSSQGVGRVEALPVVAGRDHLPRPVAPRERGWPATLRRLASATRDFPSRRD